MAAVSSTAVWVLVALAVVAVLAAARLFLVTPGGRRRGDADTDLPDIREGLRGLLADPDAAAGRDAETRGDFTAARAAYRRALDRMAAEDPSEPATRIRRRALESKLEELDRQERGA